MSRWRRLATTAGVILSMRSSRVAIVGLGLPMLASAFSIGAAMPSMSPMPSFTTPARNLMNTCLGGFGFGRGSALCEARGSTKRGLVQNAWAMASDEAAGTGYHVPHKDIQQLVEADPTPTMLISPPASGSEWFAVLQYDPMLSLSDLAQPELKLAGARFLPELDVPSRRIRGRHLCLKHRASGEVFEVTGIPSGASISSVTWAPDGSKLAFCVLTPETGLVLYTLDPAARVASKASDLRLSSVFSSPYQWSASSSRFILNSIPPSRPTACPERPRVPSAPSIQECSTGAAKPGRTYQDLLQDAHDERLFQHFATTQLVELSLEERRERDIGEPAMHIEYSTSPDGSLLLVETIRLPLSRVVLYSRFPFDVEIRPLKTTAPPRKVIHSLPLADNVPIGRDACRGGPRSHVWRADAAATLVWVEAQDGGDPKATVEYRDHIYAKNCHEVDGEVSVLARTQWRVKDIIWGDSDLAMVKESEHKTRMTRLWQINPSDPAKSPPKPYLEYVTDDRYKHPGSPMSVRLANNVRVLLRGDGGRLLFNGVGGSDDGDMPFLDFRPQIAEGSTEGSPPAERVWRCEQECYESVIAVVQGQEGEATLLTSKETKVDPPNVWQREIRGTTVGAAKQVSHVPHPQPSLLGVQKRLIKYTRASDGVELSGMLYLPAGYQEESGTLPALLWAYPQEFKNASSASQVQGSPHKFVRVSPTSPLLWVARGYAVLDDPSMPIVAAEGGEENDNFVAQLVESAEAAVDELVRMGVADDRVAVGGHSYGAFMTANLLAHSRRFRAGIGRSGAYNRLLTPFGFQSEERTLWEAPDTYLKMSPFMHADKMEAPLLLLHGEADNNPGTFPIQSERLFQALKGLGKTAKLVVLPLESHGYAARENVLHMCHEMDTWLEKHLRGGSGNE